MGFWGSQPAIYCKRRSSPTRNFRDCFKDQFDGECRPIRDDVLVLAEKTD